MTTKTKTRRVRLPHDVDGRNDERAGWAEGAITTLQQTTGADRCDALSDLLANLFHWCDRQSVPVDFNRELERARGHYEAETGKAPY